MFLRSQDMWALRLAGVTFSSLGSATTTREKRSGYSITHGTKAPQLNRIEVIHVEHIDQRIFGFPNPDRRIRVHLLIRSFPDLRDRFDEVDEILPFATTSADTVPDVKATILEFFEAAGYIVGFTESPSSALGRCPAQVKKDGTPSAIRNTVFKTRTHALRIVPLSERYTTDEYLKYHGDAMDWIVLLRGIGHLDDDLLGKLSRGEVECSQRCFNAACINIAHICLENNLDNKSRRLCHLRFDDPEAESIDCTHKPEYVESTKHELGKLKK